MKRENEDEDVANQNYPTEFLQKLEVSSAKPRKTFQITVDPLEGDDDQASYSSIHRPKVVPAPLDSDGLRGSTRPQGKKLFICGRHTVFLKVPSFASFLEKREMSRMPEALDQKKCLLKIAFLGRWKQSKFRIVINISPRAVVSFLEKLKFSPNVSNFTSTQ